MYNNLQVSFRAVDDGTQLHITGVQLSTDIHFFSQDIRVNPEVQHVQLSIIMMSAILCGVGVCRVTRSHSNN